MIRTSYSSNHIGGKVTDRYCEIYIPLNVIMAYGYSISALVIKQPYSAMIILSCYYMYMSKESSHLALNVQADKAFALGH